MKTVFLNGDLDRLFAALANPTRRAIVQRLSRGEASIGELGEPFHISQPALSRHVKVLERARLVTKRREGQRYLCRLNPEPLDELSWWVDACREFWERKLSRLESVVDSPSRSRS